MSICQSYLETEYQWNTAQNSERKIISKITPSWFTSSRQRRIWSFVRELKKPRRRRRGQRRLKNEFIFYLGISRYPKVIYYVYLCQSYHETEFRTHRYIWNKNLKNQPSEFTFSRQHRTWSFHVLVLQRAAKKSTKNYNARAQPLFCSLNLLLSCVAVLVFLNFVIWEFKKTTTATAAAPSLNLRFNEQNNGCARAL